MSEILTESKLSVEWQRSLGRAYIYFASQEQRTIFALSICNKDVGNIIKDRQSTYNITLRPRHATVVQWKSNRHYTVWVCVFVDLRIQQATCMSHIFISGMHTLKCFSTLSRKRYDFRKTITEHKMCDILYNVFWNIPHSKKKRERYNKKCISVFM